MPSRMTLSACLTGRWNNKNNAKMAAAKAAAICYCWFYLSSVLSALSPMAAANRSAMEVLTDCTGGRS